ncbi:MAG: hypothetical protein ABIQ12_09955 [Opitutaceae bacterium]
MNSRLLALLLLTVPLSAASASQLNLRLIAIADRGVALYSCHALFGPAQVSAPLPPKP